jgi:hypothetical protein
MYGKQASKQLNFSGGKKTYAGISMSKFKHFLETGHFSYKITFHFFLEGVFILPFCRPRRSNKLVQIPNIEITLSFRIARFWFACLTYCTDPYLQNTAADVESR